LSLAMFLLKELFCVRGLFPGENLRSMIGRRWHFYTVFFLKAPLLEKLDFYWCLGGIWRYCYRELITMAGIYLF
jgi:hypothetical protein